MSAKSPSLMEAAGIALAIVTILYGFALGGSFGGFEPEIKKWFLDSAHEAPHEVYAGNKSRMAHVSRRSWTYLRRAHEHANGIGTAALVMMLLLLMLEYNRSIKGAISLGLGLGALGYSSFWMFAAMLAPSVGGTGIARESLAWLAIPTAFACIAGTGATLLVFIHSVIRARRLA